MCDHQPPCPPIEARDREAARTVHRHPEQGWSRLCNGLVLFDDGGELLPSGLVVAPVVPYPRRPLDAGAAGAGTVVAAEALAAA
ncbi:MAG TPA: DUF5999 family protein [Actinocrinis sp.]|nr:DUF5999 family protein [Actinocrinis sp.]